MHHISQRERVDTCVVFDQVFDDFEVSVKAGGSQGSWVCLCRWVNVRPALHQQPDYFQVACRNMVRLTTSSINISRNMEMMTSMDITKVVTITTDLLQQHTRVGELPLWSPRQMWHCQPAQQIFMLTMKWSFSKYKKNLLDGGATPIHQIFHHLVVTIPAGASKSGLVFRKRQDSWNILHGLTCMRGQVGSPHWSWLPPAVELLPWDGGPETPEMLKS